MYEETDYARIVIKEVEYTCHYRYVKNVELPGVVCPECGGKLKGTQVLEVTWAAVLIDGKRKKEGKVDSRLFPRLARAVQDQSHPNMICQGGMSCDKWWEFSHDKLGRRRRLIECSFD